MHKVMPSQVVAVIDRMFPEIIPRPTPPATIYSNSFDQLLAILRLVREIPLELINVSTNEYADLVHAVSTIEANYSHWVTRGGSFQLPHVKNERCVDVIRNVLRHCPDEFPPVDAADLNFVTEDDLRANVRGDLGAINRSLAAGEWKSANVLAGAAIEALLYWRLSQEQPSSWASFLTKMEADGILDRNTTTKSLERWDLDAMIKASAALGVIEKQTVTEAGLTKDYRNLIHPGRSVRLRQTCDRGTAFSAVGALEHVIRDLAR